MNLIVKKHYIFSGNEFFFLLKNIKMPQMFDYFF